MNKNYEYQHLKAIRGENMRICPDCDKVYDESEYA